MTNRIYDEEEIREVVLVQKVEIIYNLLWMRMEIMLMEIIMEMEEGDRPLVKVIKMVIKFDVQVGVKTLQ